MCNLILSPFRKQYFFAMGGGVSREKAADSQNKTKASETFVGQSLASVLASSDGEAATDSGRMHYPLDVHAEFDIERYVVDENGLRYEKSPLILAVFSFESLALFQHVSAFYRKLVGGDVSGPKGVWWNDATFASEVNSAEESLSHRSTEESTTAGEEAGETTTKTATSDEGRELGNVRDEKVPFLPAKKVEETWDRFTSGTILAPDAELKTPSRPCTPPNLVRTIQVRHFCFLNNLSTLKVPNPCRLHRLFFS